MKLECLEKSTGCYDFGQRQVRAAFGGDVAREVKGKKDEERTDFVRRIR
jgi:hypothetical protein